MLIIINVCLKVLKFVLDIPKTAFKFDYIYSKQNKNGFKMRNACKSLAWICHNLSLTMPQGNASPTQVNTTNSTSHYSGNMFFHF